MEKGVIKKGNCDKKYFYFFHNYIKYLMRFFNSLNEYGLLAKLFHWITFLVLILQIPFGFYLVGLEIKYFKIV